MVDINGLLARKEELNAADLFLKPPCKPTYKISGRCTPMEEHPEITAEDMEGLLASVLRPRDQEILKMRYFEGWSIIEMGERLGVKPKYAQKLLTKQGLSINLSCKITRSKQARTTSPLNTPTPRAKRRSPCSTS